ncbi:MAG: pilin [Gammaproteobacteria bacterium]|nr:pilin [Gammaproteobacteria bacterium]
MRTKVQGGFTLLELMIVVAVIGTLASIAIPIYMDYINRSKVTEAVTLLGGLKVSMTEYYFNKGEWPTTVDAVGGKKEGKYTALIEPFDEVSNGDPSISEYCVVATMRPGGPIGGKKLSMRFTVINNSSATSFFECLAAADVCMLTAGNAIEQRYLPISCRNP